MGARETVSAAGGDYIHWGVVNIGVTNLLIITAMVLIFVLAILLPFPHREPDGDPDRGRP
jgi:hypothetical protein